MKTKDFERILTELGFALTSQSKHRIWKRGPDVVPVPQGKNINRMIARRILRSLDYKGVVPELKYVG